MASVSPTGPPPAINTLVSIMTEVLTIQSGVSFASGYWLPLQASHRLFELKDRKKSFPPSNEEASVRHSHNLARILRCSLC
jgi:hypothetical protein